MASSYVDSLIDEAKSRYRQKVLAIRAEFLLFAVDEAAQLNDSTKWPTDYLTELPCEYPVLVLQSL